MKKIFSLLLVTLFIATGCGSQDEELKTTDPIIAPITDPVIEESSQNPVGPTELPFSKGPTEPPEE
jgi:uncharacterized lipoprotein YajG